MTSVFMAKNVPSDSLELRVPIWITDLCFPDQDQVAVVSKHGHVRLYDLKGNQRRPIMNLTWEEEALSAITATPNPNEVMVGTTTGHISQYDLRMTHKGLKRKYRGCTGAIRSLDCHPTRPVFAAVGLDRFLRVFDINKPKPIQKMYLKSKLNHVLMSQDFDPETDVPKPVQPEAKKRPASVPGVMNPTEIKEEGEEFWAKLPVIRGTKKSKKSNKS